MKTALGIITLVLAGCQTQPIPEPLPMLPLAQPEASPHARIPAMIGHYTLGAYADSENPLIRHEGHAVQRVESAARWDLHPRPPRVMQKVESREPDPIPDQPKPAAVAETSPPSPKQKIITAPRIELPPAIMPTADGLIDLTSLVLDPDSEINPFAVRTNASTTPREVILHVGGIIHGPISCVIVNEHTMQPGDVIESLILEDVEPNAALFRYQGHLVRVPVAAQPIRILMPLR